MPPKAWSDKDERQYEHGLSTQRAKQIAAATVNKQRSAEGLQVFQEIEIPVSGA